MSNLVHLNLRPSPRMLRQFGAIALAGFGLLALLAWRDIGFFGLHLGGLHRPVAVGLAALAALTGLFALVFPRGNLPVYWAITLITFPIGLVVSYVIMVVLFFIIFGVVALLMRVLGHDPMHRSYDRSATSYWTDVSGTRSPESYFRQT